MMTHKPKTKNQNWRRLFQSDPQKGFNLLEMIVYISIMALILVVVVNTLIVMLFVGRNIKNLRMIEHSSITAFDRIVREVRDADSVDFALSQFDLNPGQLTLNTTDELGDPKIIEFVVVDDTLFYRENGNLQGPLIDSKVRITNLVFRYVLEGSERNIKVEMTLEAGRDEVKSEDFYISATFRGF